MLINKLKSIKIQRAAGVFSAVLIFAAFILSALPAPQKASATHLPIGFLCSNGSYILKNSVDPPYNDDDCPGSSTVVPDNIEDECISASGAQDPSVARQCIVNAQNGQDVNPRSGGVGENPEDTVDDGSCERWGSIWAWVLCPVLKIVAGSLSIVDEAIEGLLTVPSAFFATNESDEAEEYFSEDGPMYQTWANVRNIAYVVLIPITLIMVISTALGFDFLSAYTVKRALPRLFLAVIFIALSYDLCRIFIEFTNAVGQSVFGFIIGPFDKTESQLYLTSLIGSSSSLEEWLITNFTGVVALLALIVLFWSTAVLIAATGAFILMIRQIFIIGLIFVAPIAVLAWIFSEGTRWWKIWWTTFTKLLMMYPLIMGVIALGRIFAYLILNPDGENPGGAAGAAGSFIVPILGILAYVAPYGAIPFTFRVAGGIFANIAGFVNDKEKGLFDRARKSRQRKLANAGARAQGANTFKRAPTGSRRERLNRYIANAANINKVRGMPGRGFRNWRNDLFTARGGDVQQEVARNEKENADYDTWKGDDDLNYLSAMSGGDPRQLESLMRQHNYGGDMSTARNATERAAIQEARDQALSRVERVRRQMSEPAFREMTLMAAFRGGTLWRDNPEQAWEAVARVAGDDNAAAANMVAKGRELAKASGRYDIGGAGYGETLGLVTNFRNQLRDPTPTGIGGNATQRARALQQAQRTHMQNVAYSARPMEALQGKPYSAEMIAKAYADKIDGIVHSIETGSDMYINGETRQATERDFKQTMAQGQAVYNSLAASNPQIAHRWADQFMSHNLNIDQMSQSTRDLLAGSRRVQQPNGTWQTVRQNAPARSMTIRDYVDNHMIPDNDQAFFEEIREFGRMPGGGMPGGGGQQTNVPPAVAQWMMAQQLAQFQNES